MRRNALARLLLVTTSTSLGISCGHAGRLVPAKSAELVPGAITAAVVEAEGVRCSANGDAWQGIPKDLSETVTPVKVRIKNGSGRSIRILYQQFMLVGKSGRKYRPLPVLPIDDGRADGHTTVRPIYASTNFFVAPRLGDSYRTLQAWPKRLPRDIDLYQRQYRRWDDELPTDDMIAKGLPEGVLEDGGVISGFLYFDNATARETRLLFKAEIPEEEGDEEVAAVEIPFTVD